MSENLFCVFCSLLCLVLAFSSLNNVNNDYDSMSIIIETSSGEKIYTNPDWYRVISGVLLFLKCPEKK